MDDNLRYSLQAIITKNAFVNNDINIYVEDKDKEYEYEDIFARLFDKEINIINISPVGGKTNLTHVFNILKDNDELNKSLLIADLDYDIILNKNMIKHDNFIYLKRYHIENYYIEENAIVQFMKFRIKKIDALTIQELKFDNWYTTFTNSMKKLVLMYLVIQKEDVSLTNTGGSIEVLLKNNSWEIDEEKLEHYYIQAKAKIPSLDLQMSEFKKKIEQNKYNDFIPGKQYLGSLTRYLKGLTKNNILLDDLKNILISNFDVDNLSFVRNAAFRIIEKNTQYDLVQTK